MKEITIVRVLQIIVIIASWCVSFFASGKVSHALINILFIALLCIFIILAIVEYKIRQKK
jgi:hypothetical protein